MSEYFTLGINHVLDFQAFDHMLFICIMLVKFNFKDWKSVLKLVTAFTLGHSITLAISVIYKPIIPSNWVEFFIPITILITAIYSLIQREKSSNFERFNYAIVMLFGFIHGMGFANYLTMLLPDSTHIASMLLMFNLGIEGAQLIVATAFLSIVTVLTLISKSTIQTFQKLISVITILISLFLAGQNFPV